MCGKNNPWPSALKKTKPRMLVLQVLQQAERPLTAQEIHSKLERSDTPVWTSTMYRALEQFVEHGMLRKTTVLDNAMILYEINDNAHRHYAVCLTCHRVIALQSCPLEQYQPQLLEENFQVMGHRLQMYGLCSDCTAAGAEQTGGCGCL